MHQDMDELVQHLSYQRNLQLNQNPNQRRNNMSAEKQQKLAEVEGFDDIMALLEERHIDSVIPGICMNEGCDYTTGVEPDCEKGWCEACNTQTVKSASVLAGII